ncbi:MAG TPA: hypothetical protein VFS53_07295 [Gemmatimonadota bacterium]|nr:hypothetical protein [Gemmatimonadota bacterium]
MGAKTGQLQIRVTPRQKASLKRLARRAGQSVSAYVLSRALPPEKSRFEELLRALREEDRHRFALAELNDFLARLTPIEFHDAVGDSEPEGLTPRIGNYVAAMVEHAASRMNVDPPSWTADVAPLEEPWFPVEFPRLRAYLLRVAPVAFKRRNIFVDSTVGDRV